VSFVAPSKVVAAVLQKAWHHTGMPESMVLDP